MGFPVASKSQGCGTIAEFLKTYSSQITSDSVNSFALFADHVGSNVELLFSAREILGRQEWKVLLNDVNENSEIKSILGEQLKQWISQRLSPDASQPWIQAISEIVGGSSVLQLNQAEMSSLLSVQSIEPWRFSSIAILTALVTAGLLVVLKQCQFQNSPEPAKSGDSESFQSSSKAERSLLPGQGQSTNVRQIPAGRDQGLASVGRTIGQSAGSKDDLINVLPDAQKSNTDYRKDSNSVFNPPNNAGGPIQALNRIETSTASLSKSTLSSSGRLLQLAEEGSIDPNRLLLSNASSYASHWVQQISTTTVSPASYRLRLRTDSKLSKSDCEGMIKEYQSRYRSPRNMLSVVVESSRYRRAGLSQGYLPLCRSTGSNQVEYIKYG